jgi:hypothetical protein
MPKKDDIPKPLNRQKMRFVTWFLRLRDIYKAAEKADIAKSYAVRTFNEIEVQEEIERQQDVLRQEAARQEVQIQLLTNDLLDGELVRVIRKESGSVAIDAIRLGYIATGRIQAGQTRVLDPGGQGGAESVTRPANFYEAFVPQTAPAPTPILPEATPATVPQSSDPRPGESLKTPFQPPVKAGPDDAAIRARVRELTTRPEPPKPPAGPAPKRAARLIVD